MDRAATVAVVPRDLRSLAVAGALAAIVTAVAIILRGLEMAARPAPAPSELLPVLFAAAGLCAAGLFRRRSPAGAWLAIVGAGAIAALEILGVVRAWQPSAGLEAWPRLVVAAELGVVAAAAIASAYATRRPAGGRTARTAWTMTWRLLVLGGLAAVAIAAAWAAATYLGGVGVNAAAGASGVDLGPLRTSGRLAAGFIVVATLVGAWRDLAEPVRRARSRAATFRDLPRALGDELLPTAAAMRRRGGEDERARLAADLHALVLPDLRRAAAAAEASGAASDPMAIGLRGVVEDVEQLMHARQSVLLEEYGLVAALEWLAERTQQRAPIEVGIELDGEDVDDPAAVPKPLGRAAFRVALLALDNVVRHAGATRAVVQLTVGRGRLRLSVVDDGRGIEPGAAGRESRGLVDMRSEVAGVGGALRIKRRARGTEFELTWPGAEAVAERLD